MGTNPSDIDSTADTLTSEQISSVTRETNYGTWRFQKSWKPLHVADAEGCWFTAGAADGFNVMPAWLPGSLDDFVDMVIPELQRRGLFRTEYEGKTLRENLGLPKPPSRWRNASSPSALTRSMPPWRQISPPTSVSAATLRPASIRTRCEPLRLGAC